MQTQWVQFNIYGLTRQKDGQMHLLLLNFAHILDSHDNIQLKVRVDGLLFSFVLLCPFFGADT